VVAVKNKLAPLWKDLARWGVASLGKGFYEFTFSSLEDVRRVRSIASWNLNPGILKLFTWTRDFNPRAQQNSSAQVWVRFHGLAQEYWRTNTLFAIASSLGTPICTDTVTAKPLMDRTFGQFARVLIDMDLSQTLRDKILVERKGFAFFVEVEYANLLDYCNNCKMLGHHVGNCKKLNPIDETKKDKEVKERRTTTREPKKVFVQTKDGRSEQSDPKVVIQVADSSEKTENVVENVPVLEPINSNMRYHNEVDSEVVEIMENQFHAEKTNDQEQDHITPNIEVQLTTDKSQPVVSHNRFAALVVHESSEEQSQKLLEEENSQSLEVVDDTQMSSTSNKGSDATISSQNNTSNINQKNVEFLKQSWANMTELEDNLDDIPVMERPQQPPFTFVVDRNKRKSQKSKSPKKPYDTRSKVGNSKPFK
jgi:hypothetical protein